MENMIKKGFAKFLKDSLPSLSIKKLETGLSESQVFKVTLANTGQDYICKVFPVSYKERIENSTNIEDFLIEHKYSVPKTLFIEFEFTNEFGLLILEFVPGETFYHRITSGTVTTELLHNIAANLATLHSLPLSEVCQNKRIPCYSISDWISIVESWKQDLYLLLENNDIDKSIHNYLKGKIQELIKSITDVPVKLSPLHWDYNPQNILVEEDSVSGVLDFEIHRVGDNHAELGIVAYWFKFYDASELLTSFIEGYEKKINESVSVEKVEGYYLLQLLSAYKYLSKKKPETTDFEKVKKMLREVK
jgi:Ser/Thr protein kinase RdoA (MazF antagonist)